MFDVNFTIILKEYNPRIKGEIKNVLSNSNINFNVLGNGSFTGFDVFDVKLKDLKKILTKYLNRVTIHKF